MKAVALVVSARKHGNCYDFAKYMLDRLEGDAIETELVNFDDFLITPCQHCEYNNAYNMLINKEAKMPTVQFKMMYA